MRTSVPITILVAEDDADDRLMILEAFEESRVANRVDFVVDGEQLLQYLRREGEFGPLEAEPYPGVILLDLNMPRKDGREALCDMKADPALCRIPIVVLTTSRAEEDIVRTYGLGVSSFITKPVTFEGLVDALRIICRYLDRDRVAAARMLEAPGMTPPRRARSTTRKGAGPGRAARS